MLCLCEMKLCSLLFHDLMRQKQGEATAFTRLAFHRYLSLMRIGNRLDITQPQAKSLYIMEVPCRDTIKFLKDHFTYLLGHANTIILHYNFQSAFHIACGNRNLGLIRGVFIGIIKQIVGL